MPDPNRSQEFPLGDILTITTRRLVSRGGIKAVHRLLDFMTGDQLFTHQISRAIEECYPQIAKDYPELASLVVPDFPDAATVTSWLQEQENRFGSVLPVSPLPKEGHQRIDPITEAEGIFGPERVLPIRLSRPSTISIHPTPESLEF